MIADFSVLVEVRRIELLVFLTIARLFLTVLQIMLQSHRKCRCTLFHGAVNLPFFILHYMAINPANHLH